jgi:hypothetical protein
MEAWLGELKPNAAEPRGRTGWLLAKAGWRLVRGSRTILALVLMLAALWTIGGVVGYATGIRVGGDPDIAGTAVVHSLVLLAATYLLGAIVAAVDAALDGAPLDLRDAFDETRICARDLFWWAAISLAFWLGLIALVNSNARGLFIVGDLVWLVLTTFVVPLIVIGGLSPLAALGESAGLLRRRWRESLNALVGIGFFAALATVPSAAIFTHAGALARETGDSQRLLVIVGLALIFAAFGLATATREAFATLLVRDDFGDLSPREHAGPRPSRGAKARRIVVGIVATVAIFATFSAITKHDRQVLRASSSPGANYVNIASDPSGVELPAGAPVVYQGRTIGQVLGSRSVATGLKVSFHLDPGFTPSSTPGYFVVDANGGDPRLLLVSAGEAPPVSPPV